MTAAPLGPGGTLVLPPDSNSAAAIFAGHPSFWAGMSLYFKSGLILAIGLGLLFFAYLDHGAKFPLEIDKGLMAIGGTIWIAGLVWFAGSLVKISSLRYRITQRLIEREQGVFRRQTDSLDLARVKDVQLQQSFLERMLGLGTIVLFSTDTTDPVLTLSALPQARFIYEALRDAVIQIDRSRGIVSLS